MIRFIISVFVLFVYSGIAAQVAPGQYVVYFNTKNETPYSINQPEAFLSQRAIERRLRYEIEIDERDLPVNPAFLDSLESLGAQVRHASKWFNYAIIDADESIMAAIANFTFVDNSRFEQAEFYEASNVEDKLRMVNLKQKTTVSPTYTEVQSQISLNELHNLGFRGEGMRVAVIDAGFSLLDEMTAFSHLFTTDRVVATRNFADDAEIYYGHSHGTMVSSIMCAVKDGEYIGGASEAEYVFIRSETGATEYLVEEFNWVVAAEFADSVGVDVINSSLGYTSFDWPEQNHTAADLDGQTTIATRGAGVAVEKGMIVVNSAGNEGGSSWLYLGVPADHPDVLAVGSVDIDGEYSSFSSLGLPTHIYKPDITACGESAPYMYGENVYNGNGTSFSSPLVAAAVVCLWQAFPAKSNYEVIDAVRASGSNYPSGDQFTGFGIPDFYNAFTALSDSQYVPDDPFQFDFYNAFANQNSDLQLSIYSPIEKKIVVEIYDMQQRLCFSQEYVVTGASVSDIIVSQHDIAMGEQLLLVRVRDSSVSETRKVMYK